MTPIATRLAQLNVWKRGSERAPHKPLLILLALGALSRGERCLPFREVEIKLTALLKEFGPPRKSVHPEYPFWRLKSEGLWVVTADHEMRPRAGNTDPPISELRAANAQGRFSDEIQAELLRQPDAIELAATQILGENFPATLHEDIRSAVGLADPGSTNHQRRRRDPNFRNAVLVAYQYRCALCGLDLRIGAISVGLDAAHIKWHQAHGPDSVDNGMVLCSLHHKLLDYGAFTVSRDYRILVSEHVNGAQATEEVLVRHHGASISLPRRPEEHPKHEFLDWHRREVFKERSLP